MNQPPRGFTNEYLKAQIDGASPAQQLVMLYDGAIRFMGQAKEAISRNDVQARYNSNRRALEIVSYLLEILDMEKGGEVAQRLQRIYSFLIKKIMEVDFKNSAEACEEIMGHLRILRSGWNGVAQKPAGTSGQVVAGPGEAGLPPKRDAVA